MMTLLKLFERLSINELSNLAIANDGDGTIRVQDQPKIILHINNGLDRLYSKFVIKQEQVTLATDALTNHYRLSQKHAVTAIAPDNTSIPYLIDSPSAPFDAEVIKIYAVRDANGCMLPLNIEGDTNSLLTTEQDVLWFPNPKDDQLFTVMFQRKHKTLDLENEEQEVFLPHALWPALTAFVAHEVFAGMSSPEGVANAGRHWANYERVCFDVENQQLLGTSRSGKSSSFHDRGFV